MAKKAPTPVAVAAPVIDDKLLTSIVEATDGPIGYGFGHPDHLRPLAEAGLVLTNNATLHDDGVQIAVKATPDGVARVAAAQRAADGATFDQPAPVAPPSWGPPPVAAAVVPPVAAAPVQAAPVPASAPTPMPAPSAVTPVAAGGFAYALDDNVPLPAARAVRGAPRATIYPFQIMQIGQSFFIPATTDAPKPWTSFASSVSSASNRYAEEIPGETRINRKGKVVPKLRFTRLFRIYKVVENGVTGARVYRVELDAEDAPSE